MAAELWIAAWGSRFGQRLIATVERHRPAVRIDVYPKGESEAAKLKERFGGRIQHLTPNVWWRPQVPRSLPLRIGRRLLVVATQAQAAAWSRREPGRSIVVVPAGPAFGTGQHATTRLCLRALSEAPPLGAVLDVGCGSGILAIAAAKLGARRVEAFDTDPAAVRETRANARANGVQIAIRRMALEALRGGGRFDVVAANILSGTLEASAARLQRVVRRGGRVILSGIRAREAAGVAAAFRDCRRVGNRVSEGWACLVMQRR